ncbi:hypothetical protein [Aestuariivirga sp.]|uniref:hypothetical protein n=1 Tax=Aestuariivirga sp. TaxID=2650926 RepID=UPI003783C469
MLELLSAGGGMGPWALPVSVICALGGAVVLVRHVYFRGLFGFVLSFIVLLCGALIFNMMGSGLIASSSADLTEPILLSAAGMTVSALILIGFASRQENH